MKINIVTVNSGWILQKIAERTAACAPEGVTMNVTHYPVLCGYNFYVDVQNCYRGPSNGIDVGLFTHVHENDTKHLADSWFNIDYVLHMSTRNMWLWKNDKRYTGGLMSTAMPGEFPKGFWFKKRTIGIAQRGKYEGKGYHFLQKFITAHPSTVKMFNWDFLGNDWEDVITQLRNLIGDPSAVHWTPDSQAAWPETYRHFYHKIDYLLIPSKWEGGPMSMLEAAAAGVPIIASPVGWVNIEIPVHKTFLPDNTGQLNDILVDIASPQKAAYDIASKLSYRNYAKGVVQCFRKVEESRASSSN